MQNEKSIFLTNEMFVLLQNLSENSTALWGKMNAQQMLEHLNDLFNVSIEKIIFPLVTPEEFLPKYKAFLYSDKDFKENTKAPESVVAEEPAPLKYASINEAKEQLKETVNSFIQYFEKDPSKKTLHPSFGMLSFEEWVMLHYKHVKHHYRQFGLLV